MRLFFLDKTEKDRWLPILFDLYYENMSRIAPTGMDYATDRKMWMDQVSPALDKAPRMILMAVSEGELAGYVQYYTRGALLMVEEVQIRRRYQGSPLFLRLCRRLVESLQQEIFYIEAYADRRNLKSIALMDRLGMEEVRESEDSPFVLLRGDAVALFQRFGYNKCNQ